MARAITSPRLLVGEGTHEVAFFEALLKTLDIRNVQVLDCGGKRPLPAFIRELPRLPLLVKGEMLAVAITRDADTTESDEDGEVRDVSDSAENAFLSVGKALAAAGLPRPDGPGKHLCGAPGQPRVGVFIFPDNKASGSLESLCLRALEGKPEMACLDRYLRCASETASLQPGNEAKARVQAWLALQCDPDLHLGRAAQKHYWPFDHPAFDPIKTFLRDLFAV